MASIGRLILRFILVPFAICAAVTVGILVVIAGEWSAFVAYWQAHPNSEYAVGLFFLAPWVMMMLAGLAMIMLSPAVIGILIAEFFAVRSWLFHIGNGAVSALVGWAALARPGDDTRMFADLKWVLVMGLAAGITYWLIAGWSAGFWKPVFAPPAPAKA